MYARVRSRGLFIKSSVCSYYYAMLSGVGEFFFNQESCPPPWIADAIKEETSKKVELFKAVSQPVREYHETFSYYY